MPAQQGATSVPTSTITGTSSYPVVVVVLVGTLVDNPTPPFVHSCTLQGAAYVLGCCSCFHHPLLVRCCQALLLFPQLLCGLHAAIGLRVSSSGGFAVYVSSCVVLQARLVL
jgi:hypothetical protein